MDNTFKKHLYELFKSDARIWNEETKELNETLLKDLVDKLDEKILGILLSDDEAKEKFFIKVDDAYVLKQQDLKFFIDENKLDNSYTKYRNEIGLRIGNSLLSDRSEVVLNWPFKDCILEGGMTKEDQKRNEIFFNEVLAKDEIDRLLDPKALTNWKRYTKDGEKKVKELKRDEDGTIRENLIIKGNNLLALHSLEEQFAGKVKLIFIDPPFNTGDDEFAYNDRFMHSTWLTFMKNRLEVARKLLSDEGLIAVYIGHEESDYVKVLLDEVFGRENYLNHITNSTNDPSGFKATSSKIFSTANHTYLYAKDSKLCVTNKLYTEKGYDENYRFIITNPDKHFSEWEYEPIIEIVAKQKGYKSSREYKKDNPKNTVLNDLFEFADKNKKYVFRTAAIGGGALKKREATIKKSRENRGKVYQHPDEDLEHFYILNGEGIVFWGNLYKKIDQKEVPAQALTDVWTDIKWTGIASEGGVTLKNGKKPEALLKRILELGTSEKDIVLDYHLGSGTTCAVAHKMRRQYIGIEQLEYGDNDSAIRLNNVILGDSSGISEAVSWQGGGEFVHLELARWNEEAKQKILKAGNLKELETMFDELYERYFLNYDVKTKEFKEKTLKESEFKNLSLDEQKKLFVEMLDMNQMYVNFSEREDKKYKLSDEDISLSEKFYQSEN